MNDYGDPSRCNFRSEVDDTDGPRPDDRAGALLLAEVDNLLNEAGSLLDGRRPIAVLRERLGQPLTIAVAGRTNAGKSTLVNALIGARVAPTRATECTKVVTWYRYGTNQARIVRRDGTAEPLYTGTEGQLPDDLGADLDDVDRLDVWRSYTPLQGVNVVDTPGLSGEEGLADQTERLLASGAADVLVFVLGEAVREDEAKIVRDFRAAADSRYGFPGNAMGILSRADQFGKAGDDPWEIATTTAAGHARALDSALAGVVPVMGKIAETTETGGFNETHASWLRTVAALPETDRRKALRWAESFRRLDCLPPQAPQVLLDRLDMHGIRLIAGLATAETSAPAMHQQLRAVSGIAELRRRLTVLYLRPAAIHHAARALDDLEGMLVDAKLPVPQRRSLAARIQEIRDRPAMHVLAELRALAVVYSGRVLLRDGHATRLALSLWECTYAAARLAAPADATREELTSLARQATKWWKAYAGAASTQLEQQLADTAAYSALQILLQLREQS